jgi:SAM-dependent methyltransferase
VRPPPQERYRQLIARHAPGRSIIDVGCMWRVNGAYAFHAARHGAARVVGLDSAEPTTEFCARNRELSDVVEFVRGDINDPGSVDLVGSFDVVFCAGVLYHMPNPLFTLAHLRRICDDTLILASPTIAEGRAPQAAVFLPYLDSSERQRVTFPSPLPKLGLDVAFEPDRGYANWFWLFTPSCLAGMLKTAGFDVQEVYAYPRAVCYVCRGT